MHDTEKRTTVAIRQKDLDTQLELLEIKRKEAFAQTAQDKDVANEQALQLGEKQVFLLDRRKAVEEREIANEVELERQRTDRELAVTEETKKREQAEIQRMLALEQEQRDKEIALIEKAKEEELANIERNLSLEQAEKDRQIALIEKVKQEELAEIDRGLSRERAEKARSIELAASERERKEAEIALETEIQKAEEAARDARHQVAEEKAKALSEKQRNLLERRLEVEREEISKDKTIKEAQIQKEAELIDVSKAREAAEIRKQLVREAEERDRDIALVGKAEEREREIILVKKTRELEEAEIDRLRITAEKAKAEHETGAVRIIADAEQEKAVELIRAEQAANASRIAEETQAEIASMHPWSARPRYARIPPRGIPMPSWSEPRPTARLGRSLPAAFRKKPPRAAGPRRKWKACVWKTRKPCWRPKPRAWRPRQAR